MGPILATINVPISMSVTAAMPAPCPPELLQHDGLHMTGRLCVSSVDHATHLFLDSGVGRVVLWLAGLEGGCPPGPGTGLLGVRARLRAGPVGGGRRRRFRA